MDLDNISIGRQNTIASEFDIFFALVLGKSPLQALQNFLSSGKLEFSAANRFNDVGFVLIFASDAQQDLTNIDAGGDANGFSVRVAHTTRESIGSGAGKHFIGPEDVKGVGANANVVGVFTDSLDQVLVNGNTTGFQGFGRDLLLFVADQVSDKGKEIDGSLFGAGIKDANLGFGDTAAVTRLDVRLVLLVTVATSRTAAHGWKCMEK